MTSRKVLFEKMNKYINKSNFNHLAIVESHLFRLMFIVFIFKGFICGQQKRKYKIRKDLSSYNLVDEVIGIEILKSVPIYTAKNARQICANLS